MLSKPALRWCGIVLGSIGVVYVVYLSQATLILLGISFVVAYLLNPSIDRLECLGLSRTLAISLLIAVAPVSMGVLFLVIIPQLQLQVRQVAGRAPHWGQWLYGHLTLSWRQQRRRSQYFGITLDIDSLKTYAGYLWDWVMAHLPGITQGILSIFQTMFTGLANFIVGVLNILLVPVMVFYLLHDFGSYVRVSMRSCLPTGVPWSLTGWARLIMPSGGLAWTVHHCAHPRHHLCGRPGPDGRAARRSPRHYCRVSQSRALYERCRWPGANVGALLTE
jgi:predicted PurR-regulated permease PerM